MRILIIEDKAEWQESYRDGLPAEVEIVEARNYEDAEAIIKQMIAGATTFDAIVFDGCLNDEEYLDGTFLITMVKDSGYKGLMIAGSSNRFLNEMLVTNYGCTHNAKIKENIPRFLRRLLNLK